LAEPVKEMQILKKGDAAESELTTDGGQGVERMIDEVDGVDPDSGKPSEVAVALAEFLRRIIRPKNAHTTAVRFIGLIHHLAPDIIGQSITASSAQLKITRAALSKIGLGIMEEFRLPSRYHKSSQSREAYAAAQRRLVLRGGHASQIRTAKKAKAAVDNSGR
jgi:hypothetical protein